jgi:predicted  nucleic acid-binding Zn-ribbon protein
MNCRRYGLVFFLVSSMAVPWALSNTPPAKRIVEAKAASEARLVQVEVDLAAAQKELSDFENMLQSFRWPCGTEVKEFSKRLQEARERLKVLESKKAAAADLKTTKDQIAALEGYFRELKERADLVNLERAPEKMNDLRRKIVDLQTQRDLLADETKKLQFKSSR